MGRIALLASALLLPEPAPAADLEKLLMPGPLIEDHADTESECGSCHPRLRDTTQRALCLDCHEDVAADLEASVGFHGRARGVGDRECSVCHADHLGRDADVVGLDPAGFDHVDTDHPLRGLHRRVACDGCHAPGEKHRAAPGECFACHEQDDPHAGKLGRECGDCHSELGWSEARFEHDKTAFPLVGRHEAVACALCHPAERYEGTATDCSACHRLGDAHHGRFGSACGECHTPHGWNDLAFDHSRDTRFPLGGAHLAAACETCHTQGLSTPLPRDCAGCHESDDVHRGRNGPDCARCHSETRWADESFDHGRMTDFPLRGAHVDVSCERCHTGPLDQQPRDPACSACHQLDDAHAGTQGEDCVSCHNEVAWSHDVFFEHDVTEFPLLGMHAVASCDQCHSSLRFGETSRTCWDCHAREDEHLRRLGTECALCHNPNGWTRWRFDHDAQTSFALRGAHAEVDCHDCHRLPTEGRVTASTSCARCHESDDRHHGAYGSDCARCHDETAWDAVDARTLR